MSRHIRSIVVFALSAFVLWVARVSNVMAATPTEVVVFLCHVDTSTITYYDRSSSAPSQSSGASCAQELEDLTNAGLTNVNVSTQTWSATSGAPGGLTGTYNLYVLTNGTLTSGNI